MDEDIQRRIREKIGEIEEKSANGNYIYRGEQRHMKDLLTMEKSPQVFGVKSRKNYRKRGLI